MAKIFLVVFKNPDENRSVSCKQKAEQMMELLCPDHLTPTVKVECNNNTCLFLFNERNNVRYQDFTVCTGAFHDLPIELLHLKEIPASASLFISTNSQQCKVITNAVAGRCTWYYQDDEQFIVSTSQRAIIAWLGSFVSNPQAISWMLATGNLGPGNSWDKRIQHLTSGTSITLNREHWQLTKTTVPFSFTDSDKSAGQLRIELENKFNEVFSRMKIELPFTALTLSGGYDSRTVLYYMVKHGMLVPTATWGLSAALNESNTDAHAARILSDELGVPHRFYATDFSANSFEVVFDRFLRSGEGRLDHINTFMDGFRMWKSLSDSGIRQIIRADEVFGWLPAQTEQDVRISLDIHHMEDNANMLPLKVLGIEEQYYPQEYLRQNEETLEAWRDRLYRQFRLPYVLTALHDLVHSYVEVLNPFLHSDIINFCNTIPDELRTQKKLYAESVRNLIPNVPIARKASIPEPGSILRSARIVSVILDDLNSFEAKTYLSPNLLNLIPEHLFVDDELINRTNNSIKLWLKSAIPWQVKKLLRRDLVKYHGDFNQLAFRAAIVVRMHKLLKQDSDALKNFSTTDSTLTH